MLLDVADAQDVVQDQAVITHVGIHRDHSDQLRSHLGVGSNPFEGERQDGDLGPGWVSPSLHADGFSSEHLGLQVSPPTLLTRCVLRLGELGGLVIDVIQEDPHLLKGQVPAEVPGLGSAPALAPGRGPVPLAGCFNDDGVARLLLPVQVSQNLQLPLPAQLEIALPVPSWAQKGDPSKSPF